MSTRAVVMFKDDSGTYSVYKHCDGYPDGEYGMIRSIQNAKELAWPLPRFEADEFGAAFIAVNKHQPGDIRLTTGPEAHGDLEYIYTVTLKDGKLHIETQAV